RRQAGEHDLRRVADLARRFRDRRPAGERLSGLVSAVADQELVTGVEQRLGDRRSDRPQPDEPDRAATAHGVSSPEPATAAPSDEASSCAISSSTASAARKASIAAGTPQ